jgi:hypothetical protein
MKSSVANRRATGDSTGLIPPFRLPVPPKDPLERLSISWRGSTSKNKSADQVLPNFDSVSKLADGAPIPGNPKFKYQINNSGAKWNPFIRHSIFQFRPLP